MEALLALLALVAAIAALWGSAICCSAVCCCANTYGTMFAAPYGNQQVMIISQQQQQPSADAQYYRPQVMPMNFFPPAYPLGNVPPAQPYLASSSFQEQQYTDQQQPPVYGYASAPNADEILSSGVGLPTVSSPPAYSEIKFKSP